MKKNKRVWGSASDVEICIDKLREVIDKSTDMIIIIKPSNAKVLLEICEQARQTEQGYGNE